MRRALWAALGAGMLLWLLSALVVAVPPDGAAEPPAPPRAVEAAAVAMPAQGARPVGEPAPRAPLRTDAAPPPQMRAGIACAPLSGRRDANGRVLTHRRYAASVYQVFRAEAAGG